MMVHSGIPLLAGNKTTVNNLIEMASASNPAARNFDGYKPVSSEPLLLMASDVIVVSQSTLSAKRRIWMPC
ncbi:hypothetical protein M3P05_02620 [Sansalvadorimonas sp. 2012CJ34-2]|uniref:Uncharacterized protein n=1 Tax=Parendozoicomonas callyspongiae TaxID=2942213 RepID=A0ABT0PBX0_9GAMM|nr:hypothetical protein [Sansalvadorimonas sp. 2012CJ34-2]MCL6268844.1 hypothetical protein [Sansalvadorimonas sp. 2012CJ34-2]